MHDAKFQYGGDDRLLRRDDGSEVPADEPTFTIRGKDEAGVLAIARYIEVMEAHGSALALEHAESARAALARIQGWQAAHPDRVGMGCHTCERIDHRERFGDTAIG